MIDKNLFMRVYIIVYRNKKTGITRSRCWITKKTWNNHLHALSKSRIYVLIAKGISTLNKVNVPLCSN